MPRLEPMGVEATIKGLPSYLRGMDKMGSSTQRTGGILGKIGGIATKGFAAVAVGATAAIGAIGAVGGAMIKLASDAAPIAGIRDAFNKLTESIEGGSAKMLSALQDASAGMVTNTDLMKSFNLAAQLVGKDFAELLPDAMKALGKVALATGEDMGFLMDSLVRGVGRLSPMILDNLGIQVDLTAAYEEFAKANGLVVSEMSKTEQQAALMAQVMAKLEANTAEMPDVAGSAQQAFKSFGVQLRNFKDDLGLVLLPVVSELMGSFSEMAMKILPDLIDVVKKHVIPFFERIGWVISAVADAGVGSIEMWEAMGAVIGPELTRRIKSLVDNLSQMVDVFLTFIDEVAIPFVRKHGEEIVGAIKAIGAALAVAAIASQIKDIVFAFSFFATSTGAIIGLIALLGAAWAGNWGGIRDTLTQVWEEHLKPAFEAIQEWLAENIPTAIEKMQKFWENVLAPILQKVWGIIEEQVIPAVMDLFAAFQESAPIAQKAVQDFLSWFDENIVPIIESVVKKVGEIMASLATIISERLGRLADFWREHGDLIIETVKFAFQVAATTIANTLNLIASVIDVFLKILQGDWEGVWTSIKDFLIGLLESTLSIVGVSLDDFVATWSGIWENIKLIVTTIWDSIITGIKNKIDAIVDLVKQGFENLKNNIKDVLKLGSPSKLFIGYGEDMMTGLAKGIQNAFSLPDMALSRATTNLVQPMAQVSSPTSVAAPTNVDRSQTSMGDNLNLHIHTSAPVEPIIQDFRMMKALGGRS